MILKYLFVILLITFSLAVKKDVYSAETYGNAGAKVAGVVVAVVIASMILSNRSYRKKIRALKSISIDEDNLNDARKSALYQVVGSYPVSPDRKGLLLETQQEILTFQHPDFIKSRNPEYHHVFFDEDSKLLARVFKNKEGNIILVFRGSEKYGRRVCAYAPSSFKAIEWAEFVFEEFGSGVNYILVGHCAGGGNAMLSAYHLYHISQSRANVKAFVLNSTIPDIKDFLMVNDDRAHVITFLKKRVINLQNMNDPVFSKVGFDIPFLGCWNWYNTFSETSRYIKNYHVSIPCRDSACLTVNEKVRYLENFTWLNNLSPYDTWQHSALKWLDYLSGNGNKINK